MNNFYLLNKGRELRLEIIRVVIQWFIGCVQMVVCAICAYTMHVQPAKVLIRPAVQQVKQRTPGRYGDFGGVGLHLAAIAGVSVGDVVEVELL